MQVIKVKKVNHKVQLPTFGTDGAAGMDFYLPRPETFMPYEKRLVPLGIAVEVPKGHMLIIAPRSSTGTKTPLRMTNSIGVIDSDYRGEIHAAFCNVSDVTYIAHEGDRLVQGIEHDFKVKVFKCDSNEYYDNIEDDEEDKGE